MKLKLSLAASLAAAALCIAGPANASVAGITKLSTEPAVALNAQEAAFDTINVSTGSVQQGACNEGLNDQTANVTASGWTVVPTVISFYGSAGTTGEQKASRFDTGQVDSSKSVYASSYYTTAVNGSWATASTPNEARAQNQPATASYTLT